MTSRVGKASNSQSGFADWIEAAPGHPWPARHSRILRISGAARQEGSPTRCAHSSLHKSRRDGGFTYVVVLVMLIALGLAADTATRVGSQRVQAEREAELLFRGLAYQRAIKSYYEDKAVPANARALPRNLEDLLKDPRVQHRRHLRALYPDPFASPAEGSDGWRVLRAEDGGIIGVASRSRAEPLRLVNFPAGLEGLVGARTYADWLFTFTPPAPALTTPPPGGKPQPPAATTRR